MGYIVREESPKLLEFSTPIPQFNNNGTIDLYYFASGIGFKDNGYTIYIDQKYTDKPHDFVSKRPVKYPINFHIAHRQVRGVIITADGWIPADIFDVDVFETDEFDNCQIVATDAEIDKVVDFIGMERNIFFSKAEAEGVAEYLMLLYSE